MIEKQEPISITKEQIYKLISIGTAHKADWLSNHVMERLDKKMQGFYDKESAEDERLEISVDEAEILLKKIESFGLKEELFDLVSFLKLAIVFAPKIQNIGWYIKEVVGISIINASAADRITLYGKK